MQHLQQVFQLQQWTPFKILETTFSKPLSANGANVLSLVKTGLSMVNSKITDTIGHKNAAIVSGAIGLGAFIYYQIRKNIKKTPKNENDGRQSNVQSQSNNPSENENQETDLPKWLREKGDYNLEDILEVSKQQTTFGQSLNNDKVFFEVYNAYLGTQQ